MDNMNLVVEIWVAMKAIIPSSDRPEAAEAFVNVLIENDLDPKALRKAFKKDGNITRSLGLYIDDFAADDDGDADELNFDDEDDDYDDDYR